MCVWGRQLWMIYTKLHISKWWTKKRAFFQAFLVKWNESWACLRRFHGRIHCIPWEFRACLFEVPVNTFQSSCRVHLKKYHILFVRKGYELVAVNRKSITWMGLVQNWFKNCYELIRQRKQFWRLYSRKYRKLFCVAVSSASKNLNKRTSLSYI